MAGVVTVTINGRSFRMACDEGQEGHLQNLAKGVDAKISLLRGAFGDIGEQRVTVMAAIMLADELHEASQETQDQRAELRAAKDNFATLKAQVEEQNNGLAHSLGLAAEEIERLTLRLAGR
jgi:cell division protein ZapA